MSMQILIIIFMATLADAQTKGLAESREMDRSIGLLEEKAKDFIYLKGLKKDHRAAMDDLTIFLKKRRDDVQKQEVKRQGYIKTKVKSDGEKNFAQFEKRQREYELLNVPKLQQFLIEKGRYRKAYQSYRNRVSEFQEVEINENVQSR